MILKTILNKKVGYYFCQVTVAQSEWERRGHGLLQKTNFVRFLLVPSINFQLLDNKPD